MRQKKLTRFGAVLALSMLTFSIALGAEIENLPAVKTQGTILYVTGGVGVDEANAMRCAKSMYPLSLEFIHHAKPKDEFLADVNVSINNQAGETVLQVMSEGPYLLAKLPSGKYTIIARIKDDSRTRHVTVTEKKPMHVVFEWN